VRLSVPDCENASGAEIAKLVGLELAPKLTVVLDDSQPATLSARLRCADARAFITVEDAARATPLTLSLSLADTRSEARARLLALAIAELIATSRLEQSSAQKPAAVAAAKPAREAPLTLWLGAGALRAFQPASWLPTLALGAADSFGRLALSADLEFAWGEQSGSEALVQMRLLSLSLAPALQLTAGRVDASVGVGLRAGYAWLLATPRQTGLTGRQFSGVFAAPALQGALQFRLSEAWRARLAAELGYVVAPLRGLNADGATLLELSGLYASGLLAVAWTP
jgi:hypothetical protein